MTVKLTRYTVLITISPTSTLYNYSYSLPPSRYPYSSTQSTFIYRLSTLCPHADHPHPSLRPRILYNTFIPVPSPPPLLLYTLHSPPPPNSRLYIPPFKYIGSEPPKAFLTSIIIPCSKSLSLSSLMVLLAPSGILFTGGPGDTGLV